MSVWIRALVEDFFSAFAFASALGQFDSTFMKLCRRSASNPRILLALTSNPTLLSNQKLQLRYNG